MRPRSLFRRLAVLVLLPTAVAAQVAAQVAPPATRGSAPRGAWPVAKPAAVGLNGAVLDSIDAEIRSGRYGLVNRFLVIRHGRTAYDKSYTHDYDSIYADSARTRNALNSHDPTSPYNYFNPWWHPTYRRGDLHSLQSVSKTVASVIIGAAVTRGEFPSIDTPILRFFDTTQVRNIDDRKRRITVKHLLTMTGGFDWNENLPYIDPNNTAVGLEASADWIQYTIDRPMMREPGTQFNYSSGESALLAHIFRQATGMDIEEYGARHLFAPLGITRWFWKRTPSGTADTEGGLYLEAGDLARIWYLFLQDGSWNGTRVLSREWIKLSVTPMVPVGGGENPVMYGLKWWLHPDPAAPGKYLWTGSGFGGQLPVAFPDQDMVLVFNGWSILPGRGAVPLRRIEQRLQRAVTTP